ncbi:MAG: hypothetical protein LH632_01465 [Rhodoferax sp.]|nr:hypothetical protein [Rhodoferax sp.]
MYELDKLEVADWRNNRFAHPRATPEKALCDWLYLAASPRSSMRAPPLDLQAGRLDADRLQRVAMAMSIKEHLNTWFHSKRRYDRDPDVIENASMHTKVSKS